MLKGRIVDANGGVIAGAEVIASDVATEQQRTTHTDGTGAYWCVATWRASNRFGDLRRNVINGPRFDTTDLALAKTTRLRGASRVQERVEIFNLFNQTNLGQPGRIVGSPDFGRITCTRFPTGDSGSSRQVQLAARLEF